jgi:hypothetical protein
MGLSGFDLDALVAVHSVETAGAPDGDGDGYPDAADGCPAVFDPEQRDSDGDGIGDACEAGSGCAGTVEGGKLTLTKLQTPPGDDGLTWSGTLAPISGGAPDPISTGVRVVVRDASSGALLDVTVPDGAFDKATKTGWKVKRTTWTWQGGIDGLTKVKLVGKTPGQLKLTVTAKGAAYPAISALPLRARLVADGATGRCGETSFAAGDCVAQAGKGKVVCK